MGLYYSQAQDWAHPDGLGLEGELNCGCMAWGNNWDFPDNGKKDFQRCYEQKIKPQVKELLTKYGDLCLIWFDTPLGIQRKYSQELYDLVKQYQPGCLVNSRLGNGICDYESEGDNEIPEDKKEGLRETPATLNDTWGYKAYDNNWKSPEEVLRLKNHLNERGINYLLNVGPDPLGRIPAEAVRILKKVGELL